MSKGATASSEQLTFALDARVFFKHPTKSWVTGRISDRNDATQKYSARDDTGDEVQKLTEADVTLCREDLLNEGIEPQVDDLLFLTVLHDATLLRCLQVRYMKDIVYTNIGAIVVALNPFNYNIPWYKDDMMEKYLEEDVVIRKNLPHSWATAHNTYYDMRGENRPHTILVSGESGAGKTESCKLVLKYLGQVSKRCASAEQMEAAEAARIKIIQCSPILEGFGNAKTVRNNNSSRFGKYIRVMFHPNGYLTGAFTTSYLLEKSRIITAAKSERVYHAFYYLTKGPAAALMNLKGPEAYAGTNAGGCFKVDDINDVDEFNEVSKAFTIFGLTDEEQLNLWKTVAGCLVSQNIEMSAIDTDTTKITPAGEEALAHAAQLWGVPKETLHKELLSTTNTVRGETFVMNLKLSQAVDARDSLCKHLYDKLFLWIINRINSSTAANEEYPSWIGVLDIFGFEDFTTNSFEQLCINLANETLQNHYNNYIFKKDMEECRAEGVEVSDVKCPDNSECLKLVADNTGIMGYLDEECRLGTGTDEGFLAKICQNCNKNPYFYTNPLSRNTFMVKHYAGNVTYTITGFLEKNRDTLKDAMKLLMRASTNPFTKELLPEPAEGKARMTVGGMFRAQIKELMDLINSTGPHWIRCIKPHPSKKPLMFDGVQVTSQLLSSGVLGTVKIRKAGFPVRMTYPNFLSRYKILFGRCPADAAREEQVAAVRKATKAAAQSEKHIQVGKTRVFMKSEAYFELEKARDQAGIQHRLLLQRFARGVQSQMVARKKQWAESSVVIQDEFRKYLKRSEDERQARRVAREKMLAEQAKERRNFLDLALSAMKSTRTKEEAERAELEELRNKHYKWVQDLLRRRVEERQKLIANETALRHQIIGEALDGLAPGRPFARQRASLYLMSLPEVDTNIRDDLVMAELREFTAICDLFDQVGASMFRQEMERMERKCRRIIMRLEDLQIAEMRARAAMFPEFLTALPEHARTLLSDFALIKEHSKHVQDRIMNRHRVRDNQREIEHFSARGATDPALAQRDIVTSRSGNVVTADSRYRRMGDKVEKINNFVTRDPWTGVNGVPDIDQTMLGLSPSTRRGAAATSSASPQSGRRGMSSQARSAGSPRYTVEPDEEISDVNLKRANVFETFRDRMDETNFLRQRHLVAQQFKKLAKYKNYDGDFVHETSITDKKTLHRASELLQSISLEFGEGLVKVLRKLNSYCVSRVIPEQHPVTGHWHAFQPVPKEMLQTYPLYTDWQKLLVEEKRLEYTIENYKRELLKVLQQCEQRGARLPEEVAEDSSVDLIYSTYMLLKGHFECCSRCLSPMAPKATLVHMRLLWPRVTDSRFTDRCRTCQEGYRLGTSTGDESPERTDTSYYALIMRLRRRMGQDNGY